MQERLEVTTHPTITKLRLVTQVSQMRNLSLKHTSQFVDKISPNLFANSKKYYEYCKNFVYVPIY